jgi:hypothetical protein
VVVQHLKDSKAVYRLVSFDIVKKTTSTKRASATSTSIGDTENPLKSGTFYKIKVSKSGVLKLQQNFKRQWH